MSRFGMTEEDRLVIKRNMLERWNEWQEARRPAQLVLDVFAIKEMKMFHTEADVNPGVNEAKGAGGQTLWEGRVMYGNRVVHGTGYIYDSPAAAMEAAEYEFGNKIAALTLPAAPEAALEQFQEVNPGVELTGIERVSPNLMEKAGIDPGTVKPVPEDDEPLPPEAQPERKPGRGVISK